MSSAGVVPVSGPAPCVGTAEQAGNDLRVAISGELVNSLFHEPIRFCRGYLRIELFQSGEGHIVGFIRTKNSGIFLQLGCTLLGLLHLCLEVGQLAA